jgi:hypothetical protein
MTDAGLGALSVFFIQYASYLEHQEELKRTKGQGNQYLSSLLSV